MSFKHVSSNTKLITCGVPQGSILGPLGDSTIYVSSNDQNMLQHYINVDLDNLNQWFRANKLSLNAAKTNYMVFAPDHGAQHSFHVHIDNVNIERKTNVKFLGLLIDDKLNWAEHINHIKSKLSKSLFVLRSLKNCINTECLLTLYNTMASPYISYGILLWGGASMALLKKIDVMQKKLIRLVNGLDYNAHTILFFNKCRVLKVADMYKCELSVFLFSVIHHQLPNPICCLFTPNEKIHCHDTRQKMMPHVVRHTTHKTTKSLFHTALQEYQQVPSNIKQAASSKCFKSKMRRFLIAKYVA